MDLDGTGAATLFLLNPTGGVLGGDRLETRVDLGAGSRVCLSTPSATRVYRSAGRNAGRSAGSPSMQRLTARVGDGAWLEYMPDHVIPSPGAWLSQSIDVHLAPGASAVLCDAWSVGRVARDEAWLFDLLDSGITVSDTEGLLFKDRLVLHGARGWGALGGTEGMAYVATVLCVAPVHPRLAGLAGALIERLASLALEAHTGVTPLARGGVLVRILAPSAPAMQGTIGAAWAACRDWLWGLPPQLLRKM
jgi:urease accessory protein